MRQILVILALVIILIALFFGYTRISNKTTAQPSIKSVEQTKEVTPILESIIAENLEVPWGMVFISNNNLLVTERKGTIRLIQDGKLLPDTVGKINVKQIGEGGLHGIAAHPNFSENNFIYLYYTYSGDGNNTLNRVSRYIYKDKTLADEKVIVDKIPGAIFHDGGRIKFGPDGYLYITTGDALNPSSAQDKNSLAGKILRVSSDDKVEIYSYGHRNPQGITWDDKGQLWEVEHGQSAQDEINKIEMGKNYGWPTIRGDETKEALINPILHSGSDTWAPGGAAFFEDSILYGGLRGNSLFEYVIETKELKTHFKGQFGRIRDVILGPDKMLYITTSNKDGRGNPDLTDDKIIKINPALL